MNSVAVIWRLKAITKKLGLWGLLGLLLLCISAYLYWVKIPAMQADIDAAEVAQADLDQQRANKRKALEQDPAKQAAKSAAEFYTRFPSINGVPDLLRQVYQLAKRHRLDLEIGDYRYKKIKTANTDEQLTQYKMTFPVEGRYTDIRKFIDYALSQSPEMALLDLQVVREDRHTTNVTARIVFAVYVKKSV